MGNRSDARAPYADAAQAGRDLIRAALAASPKLTATEWKVLAAVIGEVTLWSRIEDRVAGRILAELSGVSEKQTRRLLRKLSERGIGLTYIASRESGLPAEIRIGRSTADLGAQMSQVKHGRFRRADVPGTTDNQGQIREQPGTNPAKSRDIAAPDTADTEKSEYPEKGRGSVQAHEPNPDAARRTRDLIEAMKESDRAERQGA